VGQGRSDRGILVCSTGIGMAMAANKIAGVRAAPAQSEDEVHMTREHNDANVLTLGAKYLDEERALELIHVFLNTEFCRRSSRAPRRENRPVGFISVNRLRRRFRLPIGFFAAFG
jgi:RpiB/LacA/LacB family sugar-phosphate isomerase